MLLSAVHLRGGNLALAESDCLYERDTAGGVGAEVWRCLGRVAAAAKAAPLARRYAARAAHAEPWRKDLWTELAALSPKPAASAAALVPPAAALVPSAAAKGAGKQPGRK